ncbi:MAG TPA: MFS transporter [Ferrovibrio sp.]|uniref:MFS transporter n=1 Tax=Ferrovibrio sp. TaxID=1917215 RepID=UPI002ED529AD
MATLPSAFRRLAWSNLAAQSAEQIGLASAPILAVLALGADAGETGILQTAQTLPFLLLSIPAGILADRVSRPRLMAGAEALRVAAFLAIVILAMTGRLSLPALALLGFVGAAGTVAYGIAAPALVPALVARGSLALANRWIELARTVAFTAGPSLGGLLVGWIGGGPAFGIAAALSLAAVLLLAGLREPPRNAKASRAIMKDLAEGAGFVLHHPLLMPILLTQVIFNIAFFILQAAYAPYALGHLGLSASQVGLTLACYGFGMVTGALLAPRIMERLSFGAVIGIGPVSGFVAAGVMLATLWLPGFQLACTSFFLMGAGPILWVISTTTLRQSVTPPAMLGRVSAINSLAYGARPVGAAIGTLVGGAFGAEACLIATAIGFLAQMLLILASPATRLALPPELQPAE